MELKVALREKAIKSILGAYFDESSKSLFLPILGADFDESQVLPMQNVIVNISIGKNVFNFEANTNKRVDSIIDILKLVLKVL